ncbi:MAG: hypothetical protein ABR591_15970 [Candidatus Velthaea sp.]
MTAAALAPPTASGAAVPPPVATPKATDPHTAFALLEQPVALNAPTPVLADGTPLAAPDASGNVTIDAAVAKATFSYAALLYRIDALGGVDIFNGKLFTPEAGFDITYPDLKATELAFDAKMNAWTGVFVLSTVATSDPTFAPTNPMTLRPRYGFLTVLRIPRKPPAPPAAISASRSALGAAVGIIAAADTSAVKAGLLQGSDATQDPKDADGFSIVAKDASLVPVASFVISANSGVPAGITLHVMQGGGVRASVIVNANGDVTVTSATQATIAAPVVNVAGELRAQNIRYRPYNGDPERYL